MAHVEVLVEFDHRNAEGFQEPHILQLKLDGLPADLAWDRAFEAVNGFLLHEQQLQELVDANRPAQLSQGQCDDVCVHDGVGYHCNLPPGHASAHKNFASDFSWAPGGEGPR